MYYGEIKRRMWPTVLRRAGFPVRFRLYPAL